jgi:hypothetical protein
MGGGRSPVKKQCSKGVQNLSRNPVSQDPIRLSLLREFKRFLKDPEGPLGVSSFDGHMVWTSFLFAFFGLMRVSEYTDKLLRKHLVLERDCVRLELIGTKNCPNRSSFVVLSRMLDLSICPVEACRLFLKARDSVFPSDVSLFRFSNGDRYSPKEVNGLISRLATMTNQSHLRLSSHSLRIGGASEAARAGVHPRIIQLMGRWSSDCFMRYIRSEESDVLRAQRAMASGQVAP